MSVQTLPGVCDRIRGLTPFSTSRVFCKRLLMAIGIEYMLLDSASILHRLSAAGRSGALIGGLLLLGMTK